jgi:hypothetical protein
VKHAQTIRQKLVQSRHLRRIRRGKWFNIGVNSAIKTRFTTNINLIKRPTFHQNAPTFYQNAPLYFQNKSLSTNILCDSNVYKCLPTILFCSNILFLFYQGFISYYINPWFYYIFINLVIKAINLINDDCI